VLFRSGIAPDPAEIMDNVPTPNIEEESKSSVSESKEDIFNDESISDLDPLNEYSAFDDETVTEIDKVDEEKNKPAKPNFSNYANTEDDFSTIMDGVFEKDEPKESADKDEWFEVENLLEDDLAKEIEGNDAVEDKKDFENIDPMQPGTPDETSLLLESLSAAEIENDIEVPSAIEDAADDTLIVDEGLDIKLEESIATVEDDIDLMAEPLESGKEDLSEQPDENHVASLADDSTLDEISSFVDEESIMPEPALFEDSIKEDEIAVDASPAESNAENSDIQASSEPETSAVNDEEDDITINDLMDNPTLITPTFGEILIAQKKFTEARHVFSELLNREPDNVRIQKKILL